MAINLGSNTINKMSLGSNEISKGSLGNVEVFGGVYMAQDSDFVKIGGFWIYKGTELEIEIPTYIQGELLTRCSNMFSNYSTYNATQVTKVVINHNQITNMSNMFNRGTQQSIDLSQLNTSNVTDFSAIFYSNKATTLDLSGFTTTKATTMVQMFNLCVANVLDLSTFDLSNNPGLSNMFTGATTTVGYARTQADANKFNSTAGKPAGLTFVVKP